MAVNISRNPLSFRARAKEVLVVVDANDKAAGVVRIKVCEMPRGILQELRDDEIFYRKEVESLTTEIETNERHREEAISKARESGTETTELISLRDKYKSAIETYLHKRKEARRLLAGVLMTAVKWGVCGHNEEDFKDEETGDVFAFQEEPGSYDGIKYRVASDVTLQAYASVGLPFLQSVFDAVNLWQRGETRPPEQVWVEAIQRKEHLRQLVEIKMKEFQGAKEVTPPDPLTQTETTPAKVTNSEPQNS